jgi:natural product precursor
MEKKKLTKLTLNKETLRELSDSEARGVMGGSFIFHCQSEGRSCIATPDCFPCQTYVQVCTQSCTGGGFGTIQQ